MILAGPFPCNSVAHFDDFGWPVSMIFRNICFDSFEPVSLGLMTKGLWGDMEPREPQGR